MRKRPIAQPVAGGSAVFLTISILRVVETN
jgi:hypothetical protein